jgi:hypothetical protein
MSVPKSLLLATAIWDYRTLARGSSRSHRNVSSYPALGQLLLIFRCMYRKVLFIWNRYSNGIATGELLSCNRAVELANQSLNKLST